MYHRVTDTSIDPWGLAVSPANFDSQLQMLRRNWEPISLSELVAARKRAAIPHRGVAITFDDGYADNLAAAAPALRSHDIPAILFVATGLVDQPHGPWWDRLQSLVLEIEQLPGTLELFVGDRVYQWSVPPLCPADRPPRVSQLRPWLAQPGSRLEFYYQLWQVLRRLDAASRDDHLSRLARWSKAECEQSASPAMLTMAQLHEFASLPGFEIGAHTVTHPTLPHCPSEQQRQEIGASREWLRCNLRVDADHFAYPHGDWDSRVATHVREAGFQSAWTTQAGAVGRWSQHWALPRLTVDNVPGEQLHQAMLAALNG
jgi:peptidoglycan/xylan/chitin deacetylase (PgdA/CDA1 family)